MELHKFFSDCFFSYHHDWWIFDLDINGVFSVSLARYFLDLISIKVNVLAWRLRLTRLPTHLNMMENGIDVDSNLSSLVNVDHLS